jgi:hypothetical protein
MGAEDLFRVTAPRLELKFMNIGHFISDVTENCI